MASARGLLSLLLIIALSSCSHHGGRSGVFDRSAVKLARSGYYIVQRGDTLSHIALRFNMNYKVLGRYNGIRHPYNIYPGQKLTLRDRGVLASSGSGATARQGSKPNKAARTGNAEHWVWPTSGNVQRGFSTSGKVNKGIDVGGNRGQRILAARSGQVVYAGDGLKAYGLLIIIKHDDQYISAYAYNEGSFVKEGDVVKRGQKIALMGSIGGQRPTLHFEIRRDGRPVDPTRYLPNR